MTELDPQIDPELLDDETEGVGSEERYDGLAVESIPYDPSQFEFPDIDFVEGDYDD